MPAEDSAKSKAASQTPAGASVGADGRSSSTNSAWILPAYLETADGRRIDCTLLDVSSRGARLVAWEPLAEGETVMLRSRDLGDTKARVLWVGADTVALEFVRGDTAGAAQIPPPRPPVVGDEQTIRGPLRRAFGGPGVAVGSAAAGRGGRQRLRGRPRAL